jgi:hypothetical protein
VVQTFLSISFTSHKDTHANPTHHDNSNNNQDENMCHKFSKKCAWQLGFILSCICCRGWCRRSSFCWIFWSKKRFSSLPHYFQVKLQNRAEYEWSKLIRSRTVVVEDEETHVNNGNPFQCYCMSYSVHALSQYRQFTTQSRLSRSTSYSWRTFSDAFYYLFCILVFSFCSSVLVRQYLMCFLLLWLYRLLSTYSDPSDSTP